MFRLQGSDRSLQGIHAVGVLPLHAQILAAHVAVCGQLAVDGLAQVEFADDGGVAKPVSIMVDTFGTGTVSDEKIEQAVEKVFDLTPAAIIRELDLRKPIYRKLAAYGHMGREDLGVKWENTDRVDALKAAVAAL